LSAVPAIRVEKLSKSFLKVRGLLEVILSFSVIAKVVSRIPLLRRLLERDVVFEDISFSVDVGDLFGIFGANGNGKSTLAYCLANLLEAESGKIFLHGEDASLFTKANKCLVKCGRSSLYGAFTAIENIRFVAGAYSIDRTYAEGIALSLLKHLGVSEGDAMTKYVSRLSVGNRGKVALVVSLLPIISNDSDPGGKPILILDEPTLGFDALSVERFFGAVTKLREIVPDLTIILSTNDPREAAFCDNYRAILGRSLEGDAKKLEALRASTSSSKEALSKFAELLGARDRSEEYLDGALDVGNRSRTGTFSPLFAFFRRETLDRRRFPFLTAMLLLSIVVPNLIALFASTPSRGVGPALVMTIFGVSVSLCMREFSRWHSREFYWFKTIELVMGFPISRVGHFAILTLLTWWNLFRYIVGVTTILLVLLWGSVENNLLGAIAELSADKWLGVVCVVFGILFAMQAVGLMIGLVPIVTRGEQTIFLVMILPGLVIASGGIFYPIEVLPPILRGLSHLNPVTYGSVALSELLDIGASSELVIPRSCCDIFPTLSYAWANVIVLLVISCAYSLTAAFVFIRMEAVLRRIGRFRNQG
jgi:ABC-2 type transport system ATP-binding protein